VKNALWFLCFLLIVPFSLAQGPYTLEQVYAKLDDVAKAFRSSQSDLERTHVTIIVPDDKDIASGKFYYARKGKEPRAKMELMKPVPQFALVDKGKIQIYNPKIKQVQQASLGDRKDQLEMFMSLAFGQSSEDLKKNFNVTLAPEESVDGQKTTVLDLKPKSGSIKGVRMWLDQKKWVAVKLQVTESSGDYFILKYSNIKLNENIPESVFDLKLPKDVTILKL